MFRKAGLLAGIGATLGCALAQIQMTPYQDREPNDSLTAPQVIDAPVNGAKGFVVWDATLLPVGDRDFYRFEVAQAGAYALRVDTNLDTVLRLYDASGALIAENDNDGNPDTPLNRLASGVTVNLGVGTYTVEVAYYFNLGRARYALRVFPGTTAPDYDPTEPNDTDAQAINLGRLSGGELITPGFRFLSYGGGDVDVYRFDLDNTGQTLTIRTQTYVDTVMRVVAPNGQVYESDESEWDSMNPGASEVQIPLAPRGTYYVFVRGYASWGGYYRLRVSAPLPTEIVLQSANAEFRLRDLAGSPTRFPFNNADWLHHGADHFYAMGWWYRVQETHTRERAISNFYYYDQATPDHVVMAYMEEGLILAVQYELRATADGGSVLYADVLTINFQFTPRVIHLYHYADVDLSGATTNQANGDSGQIRVETSNDACRFAALSPHAHWQVAAHPQIIDRLTDTVADNLADGELPFEGDFTGAYQWTLELQPFASATVRVAYALNTAQSLLRADVNRNGCVDDADLLQVLFDFGRTAFMLGSDVNGDGVVDDADLLEVLFQFGAGC
ncbi:MAG: DVUA0089 family protein [Fimbriimonadales bacterium]|nr:MAG: hypothetical protein KatS3mg018_1615 [Fimbriimonadales bacterium]